VEPEVVVVGGGAIGVSAAYELARRGIRTTLLERGELGAGCSSGNAGLLCPSHSHPLATPAAFREGMRSMLRRDAPLSFRPRASTFAWLAQFAAACRNQHVEAATDAIRALSVASLAMHAELAPLGTGFERLGILSVYESEERFADDRREAMRSELPCTVLTPDGARALEPALRGPIAGGIFFRDEAHVDPVRYVRALGEAAAAAGAELDMGVEVRSIAGGKVETDTGSLRPRTVVLATGAWSERLARSAGVAVPITGGKGYHLDFAPRPDDPHLPILIQDARSAVTPLDGRLRVAGMLEVAGVDLRISRARVDSLRRAAARVLRLDERSVIDVWAGLRPCAPDGLPVIGRPAAAPSLVLATGHAMKGLSLAPVTARLVAELVGREPPSQDLTPFSPDRFRRAGAS
jgi:D-amino-acid dehydrogenase